MLNQTRSIRRRNGRRVPDADLTSMVDMMFILIVFFLITAAMVKPLSQLELPIVQASIQPGSDRGVIIEISAANRLSVNSKPIALDQLGPYFLANPLSEAQPVIIRSDKRAQSGTLVELLDHLRRLQIETVSIDGISS